MKCHICKSIIHIKEDFFIYNNEVTCMKCGIDNNLLNTTYYYDRDTAIEEIQSMINYHRHMVKHLDNYDEHKQFTDMRNNYCELSKQEEELIKKLKE